MKKVVYVTCGSLGAGHLVRGIGLARALERAGARFDFRIISPIEAPGAMREALEPYGPTLCPVDSKEVLDPSRALGSKLAQALRAAKPDLLIVDLFWAPLLHIREQLSCDAWLLVRSCPPIWLVGNAQVRYLASQYQRVIGIEPVLHDEIREHISPMVVCDRDDAKSRAAFCERFGADTNKEVVAISHAGLPGEIDKLKQAKDSGDISVVRLDLHQNDAVFPIAPWLANVDRVYCSAGYNSFWEAKWLGFAERTTFSVFKRKIDDPLWRVKSNRDVVMHENGADVLANMIIKG